MAHYNAICQFCGKFMSYAQMGEGVAYIPYGTSWDFEPPDEEFIHRSCWDADEKKQRLIKSIAWQGPHVANHHAQ